MTQHVQVHYDTAMDKPEQMDPVMHCQRCLNEWRNGVDENDELIEPQSPKDYARLQIGIHPEGLQVWCNRHECNVAVISFGLADGPAPEQDLACACCKDGKHGMKES